MQSYSPNSPKTKKYKTRKKTMEPIYLDIAIKFYIVKIPAEEIAEQYGYTATVIRFLAWRTAKNNPDFAKGYNPHKEQTNQVDKDHFSFIFAD